MASHAISNFQLTPGSFIHVSGTVDFCRLTRLIEGDELREDQNRRKMHNQIPIERPYTTITVKDAQVVPSDPSGQLTIDEQYINETFYARTGDPGMRYSIINKSPNPPKFYEVETDENGVVDKNRVKEIVPQGELAQGVKVLLILRVYKPKNFMQNGISLDAVIVQEKARYFTGSGSAVSHLAQMGIVVTKSENDAAPAQATPAAPVSAPQAGTDPYSSAAQNAPMTSMPAPEAPAASDDEEWVCPTCGKVNTGKFCQNCASPKPVGNPYPQQDLASQMKNGIQYDPNDVNRY